MATTNFTILDSDMTMTITISEKSQDKKNFRTLLKKDATINCLGVQCPICEIMKAKEIDTQSIKSRFEILDL